MVVLNSVVRSSVARIAGPDYKNVLKAIVGNAIVSNRIIGTPIGYSNTARRVT